MINTAFTLLCCMGIFIDTSLFGIFQSNWSITFYIDFKSRNKEKIMQATTNLLVRATASFNIYSTVHAIK
jgi:hypothetical protein